MCSIHSLKDNCSMLLDFGFKRFQLGDKVFHPVPLCNHVFCYTSGILNGRFNAWAVCPYNGRIKAYIVVVDCYVHKLES